MASENAKKNLYSRRTIQMKEKYTTPELKCIEAKAKDLITASNDDKVQLPDVENPFA